VAQVERRPPLIDVDSMRLKEVSDLPTIDTHGEIDMPISPKLRNGSLRFGKGYTKPCDKVRPCLSAIFRQYRTGISSRANPRREYHLNAAVPA
jgi:hypothetical protein